MTATPFVSVPWQQPQGVSSVLVSGPTDEPLTLADGKLRAGLDWPDGDPRDDLMKGFIQSARSQVEQDTGLALLTQTRDVTFADTTAALWLPLPVQAWPVQSAIGPDGTVYSGTTLTLNQRLRAMQMSVPTGIAGTWRIVAGWPTVDALKAEAPLLVQAVGLLTAHYATFGRDTVSDARHLEAIPYGYDACIAPYQLISDPLMTISIATRTGERLMRVQLDAPGPPVPDGDGGYTDSYAPLNPPMLSAKIEPATATSLERLVAGTILTTITHVITVPFHPDITTQTRIRWTDDAGRSHAANVGAVTNIDERCHTLVIGATEQVP